MQTTKKTYGFEQSTDVPGTADLLSEVERVYMHLADCLTEMRQVASEPIADLYRYTRARYKISNASLKRRQLFYSICSHLEPRLSPADAQRLGAFRQKDCEYQRHSASHVRKWTAEAVMAAWHSYRKDVEDVARHLDELIEEQLRVLTPLLIRHGCAGRRSCHVPKGGGAPG